MQLKPARAQRGVLLLEVLVALLLAGLALVSLGGVHAMAVRNTRMGLHRAEAAQRVADLAERLRANRVAILSDSLAVSAYQLTLPWAAQQGAGASTPVPTCEGPAEVCSPVQFAQADMAHWRGLLRRTLPSGAAWVQVDALAGWADIWVAWADTQPGRSDEAPRVQGECPGGFGVEPGAGVRCLSARVTW